MKCVALLLCAFGLLTAVEREGNFEIRFEPTAKLQTGVEVPFEIRINDALHKPLPDARVTLQIEMSDHSYLKVFPAPALNAGVYLAKPIFPFPGEWNIYVQARRSAAMSARTIQFSVSE
ncbi:MAG: FixH family protein [Bryobacteraceae bacterium]